MLHVVDLVTGAHLEWNTVFGYSPTIGIRFVGQGNMTFAQLVAATRAVRRLLAWRVPDPRGVRVALGVLAGTVVVMGVPLWGNDFGACSPPCRGSRCSGWLLLGTELRVRERAWICSASSLPRCRRSASSTCCVRLISAPTSASSS